MDSFTNIEEDIQSIHDISRLNDIIRNDCWTSRVSVQAFLRIQELSKTNNDENDSDVLAGGENPMPDPMMENNIQTEQETGNLKRPANENIVDLIQGEDEGKEDLEETERKEAEDDIDLWQHYSIETVTTKRVEKYKATAKDYTLKLKNLDKVALDALPLLSGIIDHVLQDISVGVRPRDMVRIILQAPGLDKPIALPFIKKDDLTMDRFMTRVEHVLQSKKDVRLDTEMAINFVHMEMPQGAGKRSMFQTWEEKKEKMYSIVPITNTNDDMCMARAIVTGRAKHELHSQCRLWKDIRKGEDLQTKLAKELHTKAQVPFNAPCGLDEVKLFQLVTPDYQLCVISKEQMNKIIWKGPKQTKEGIYLLYNDGHFDLITSMSGYLKRNYWCHPCKKAYTNKREHECELTCKICKSGNCTTNDDDIEAWTYCQDCNRYFKSIQCHTNHKEEGSAAKKFGTICDQIYKCGQCNRLVNRLYLKKEHECSDMWCRVCHDNFPVGHKCYIKPVKIKEAEEDEKDDDVQQNKIPFCYIFFDVEAMQETGVHIPNLCVAQKVCENCSDQPLEVSCDVCGDDKQVIFKGTSCMKEFCLWLLKNERHKRAKVFAHNFKGYDGYFILQFLYDNAVTPEVIMNGAKVMSITVPGCRIVFKDSLSFFPMALSKLPKAFGERELAKGYFPHLKNTVDNADYEGSIPEERYFDPDSMSVSAKNEFQKWYDAEKRKGEEWNLQTELLKYCINDVDILRRCCMKFRRMFMEVTQTSEIDPGVDPLDKPITIAAACNLVLRRNFLQPETIAIIPPNGYSPGQNFSRDSIVWLNYKAIVDGTYILHAMNGGESRLYGRVTADGFCLERRKMYSYHGCLFHGCRTCYDEDTVSPLTGKPMAELYRMTLFRKREMQHNYPDYTIEEVWECDWKKTMKDLPEETKKRIEVSRHMEAMNPREALYGGRTECNRLYHEVKDGEVIRYLDFTSLYPHVNKSCEYIIGHPKIYRNDFGDVSSYFGLIRCTVLPPRWLYHPVLPVRCHGKLMFALCGTCMEEKRNAYCPHSDKQRVIRGTWVTLEVQKAIEMGYEVKDIEVVWHWDQRTVYDPDTQSGGLFTEYINRFLQIKQEASGYPDWCKTKEEKAKYVEDYYINEGIRLNPDNIRKNPGLRSLAKLCLNSMWGKFAQRTNMSQTNIFDDPEKVYKLLTNDAVTVDDIRFINEEVVEVTYKEEGVFTKVNPRTNVVIAAFTTCHARLKLYEVLEKLGDRAMYQDTDSVVFVSCPGDWEPPTGDFLGQLTDEVAPHNGNHIVKFASGGCKNYCYETDAGITETKVRGITLNARNVVDINPSTLERMIKGFEAAKGEEEQEEDRVTVTNPRKITRNVETKNIESRRFNKDYRIVFDKRWISDGYDTLPYGYGVYK